MWIGKARAEGTGGTANRSLLANCLIYMCNEEIKNMKGGGGEGGTIADVKKYIVEGNGEDGESV
jgi:hypothetical protein